ncbi:MAG: HIT family protein [Ignavibacteria bacterium]
MNDCIFCKIVNGELPCNKLYEDSDILAFMDIQPVNSGHLLIIPKVHVELIADVDDNVITKMNLLAKRLNTAIRNSGIKVEGINFFLADGEAAGQEVFHVHLHVFPRFKGDGFGFIFPDDYKTRPERDELKIISEKIKSALNSF